MTLEQPINCYFCKHYDWKNEFEFRCEAFPKGIPTKISCGMIVHDHPIEGDNGIEFERPDNQIKNTPENSIYREKRAQLWLAFEDSKARQCRLDRLKWMSHQLPQYELIGFRGGWLSKYLYEECRYCFVYGQFLATIVLGLAFIEQSLASLFYTMGKDDIARKGIWVILQAALKEGWISQKEYDNLEDIRKTRNPITHFREYDKPERIEARFSETGKPPYEILEEDAYHVLETIFHLIRNGVLCEIIPKPSS